MPECAGDPLLVMRGVRRTFKTRSGLVRAVDGVDLELREGETLALVGESGSGKTTLARIIVGLEVPDEGSIRYRGLDLREQRREALPLLHEKVSMVFQDSYASLDSRLPLWRSIEEPLAIHSRGAPAERRRRAEELLGSVGLDPAFAERRPTALSGGQRQRAAIARAIALDPELVVLDEPVSALDVSVQAQVLNLLSSLRERLNLAYLLVSHDLAVARHVADRVAVMYLGRLVEEGPTERIFNDPRHPYTIALVSSAVDIGEVGTEAIRLEGDPPSPIDPPSGCRFRTRCFRSRDLCAHEDPALRPVDGREIACHFPGPPAEEELARTRKPSSWMGESDGYKSWTYRRGVRQ